MSQLNESGRMLNAVRHRLVYEFKQYLVLEYEIKQKFRIPVFFVLQKQRLAQQVVFRRGQIVRAPTGVCRQSTDCDF